MKKLDISMAKLENGKLAIILDFHNQEDRDTGHDEIMSQILLGELYIKFGSPPESMQSH